MGYSAKDFDTTGVPAKIVEQHKGHVANLKKMSHDFTQEAVMKMDNFKKFADIIIANYAKGRKESEPKKEAAKPKANATVPAANPGGLSPR